MNKSDVVAAIIALVIGAFAAGFIVGVYHERQNNPIYRVENLLK